MSLKKKITKRLTLLEARGKKQVIIIGGWWVSPDGTVTEGLTPGAHELHTMKRVEV